MKIATLGSGNMARALAGQWARAGHSVFFGSRTAEKGKAVADEIGFGAQGGTNEDAMIQFQPDVILHTVRLSPKEFLSPSAAALLDGKTIIDLNNHDFPRPDPVKDLAGLSLAGAVQAAHPQSNVVKAYNTMAMEVFDHDPKDLRQLGVSAFIAGNDPNAVQTVSKLSDDLGLHPVPFGTLEQAWLLEAQGDFIRTLIFKDMDPMMTINARSIPKAASPLFERKQGTY
mmetsp:Transcript_15585/g.34026  ORF Transcript_15585/g.34026 Transcript_15585/m.34026 type:complete len:228 (-) Transcript_15585:63-746(-)